MLTSLIGREATLARLEALLRSARLVTLLGAPGIGKTRVALELARRSAVAVRSCSLSEVRSAVALARAVAGVDEVELAAQQLTAAGELLLIAMQDRKIESPGGRQGETPEESAKRKSNAPRTCPEVAQTYAEHSF